MSTLLVNPTGVGRFSLELAVIRSRKYVTSLVNFQIEPARVDYDLIELLWTQVNSIQTQLERLFKTEGATDWGAIADTESIYQMTDGEDLLMALIEILSKMVAVRLTPAGCAQAELRSLRWLLTMWQKRFLKVMTVW